jgi:hypothetical protein
MFCCDQMAALADLDCIRIGSPHSLPAGRIQTEIDTEYFLAFGSDRPTYFGIHYCPFCGRVVSRELWNREKKR